MLTTKRKQFGDRVPPSDAQKRTRPSYAPIPKSALIELKMRRKKMKTYARNNWRDLYLKSLFLNEEDLKVSIHSHVISMQPWIPCIRATPEEKQNAPALANLMNNYFEECKKWDAENVAFVDKATLDATKTSLRPVMRAVHKSAGKGCKDLYDKWCVIRDKYKEKRPDLWDELRTWMIKKRKERNLGEPTQAQGGLSIFEPFNKEATG